MYISFTDPRYLFFLFGIPIFIFIHFYSLRNIKGNSVRFANFEAIARIRGIDIYSKNIFGLIFNVLMFTLLVLALSGLTINKEVKSSSFSYVIAIDSSDSMSAKDISPNRISAAKETAIDFIDSLPFNSKVAVISFSGDSKIVQELTNNKDLLKNSIQNIEISDIKGTDVNEVILNSLSILRKEENRALILLSDGQINAGDIGESIDYAKENNLIVHCFGIGSFEGGEASFGMSKLDESTLKSLSYNTNGKYFSINSGDGLKKSFEEVIVITKKLGEIRIYPYLIIGFLILFIVKEFLVSINKIIF